MIGRERERNLLTNLGAFSVVEEEPVATGKALVDFFEMEFLWVLDLVDTCEVLVSDEGNLGATSSLWG